MTRNTLTADLTVAYSIANASSLAVDMTQSLDLLVDSLKKLTNATAGFDVFADTPRARRWRKKMRGQDRYRPALRADRTTTKERSMKKKVTKKKRQRKVVLELPRRIGVFYLSYPDRIENGALVGYPEAVAVPTNLPFTIPVVLVRCEIVPGATSLMDALDRARPRPGETVMNSHYIE